MTSGSSQPENRYGNDHYDSRGGGGAPNELGRGGVEGCMVSYHTIQQEGKNRRED